MSIKGALIFIPSKIEKMLKDYAEDLDQAWTNAWSSLQGQLFDQIEKMDTDLKKDGTTMEISSGGSSVTLGKKTDLPDLDKDNKFYNGKK